MIWQDVKDATDNMSPEQLKETVVFAEHYDDGECHYPELVTAEEDIMSAWGDCADDAKDAGDEVEVVVPKGMLFLS